MAVVDIAQVQGAALVIGSGGYVGEWVGLPLIVFWAGWGLWDAW